MTRSNHSRNRPSIRSRPGRILWRSLGQRRSLWRSLWRSLGQRNLCRRSLDRQVSRRAGASMRFPCRRHKTSLG
jgi:hypothetical protein